MGIEVADFLTAAEVIEQAARFIFFGEFRFTGIEPPDFDAFFVIVIPHFAQTNFLAAGLVGS